MLAAFLTAPRQALGDSGFQDNTLIYNGIVYKIGTNGTDGDNNSVTITTGDSDLAFVGGYWKKEQNISDADGFDSTSGNRLTMEGGDAGRIYGGYVRHRGAPATASENVVIINRGNVVGSKPSSGSPDRTIVYGAYAVGIGDTGTAITNSNSVVVNGGNIIDAVKGAYAGGDKESGYAEACGNSVVVNGGELSGAFGGDASAFQSISRNNSVIVTGGTLKATGEDAAVIIGGIAETEKEGGVAEASYNRVVVQGGSLRNGQDIYGGRSQNLSGWQTELSAKNNTVILDGGSLTGIDVVSGYIYSWEVYSSYSATNNRMVILNNPDLSGSCLYGGKYELGTGSSGGGGDVRTGNSLEIHGAGLTAANVRNFENYHFYLPGTVRSGDTVLTLTDTAGTDISNSSINVAVEGGAAPLQKGDRIALLTNSAGGLKSDGATHGTISVTQGSTIEYAFILQTDDNSLYAVAAKSAASLAGKKSKALSEGYLAGMLLTRQGADLAAGPGMEAAVRAVDESGGSGLVAFGTLSGGSLRYDTGSHVDMKSISLLTGLAWGADTDFGRLTAGAFFEYGNGSYDTCNSFRNASLNGNGDAWYLGGGILARMDFLPVGPGHVYAEASGRGGSLHNEYNNDDLRDAAGVKAAYDSSSAYYGMHLGAGYIWEISESARLDLHAKYFWTHQEGDDANLSTGEHLHFDDIDSRRLRLGGRFTYDANEHVSPYIGVAWEHEFDGKANAVNSGLAIESPSLEGDTGMGELGISLAPSTSLPLFIDLGVQGYVGQREGVTGKMMIRFTF